MSQMSNRRVLYNLQNINNLAILPAAIDCRKIRQDIEYQTITQHTT